jgi:hypothetical protein
MVLPVEMPASCGAIEWEVVRPRSHDVIQNIEVRSAAVDESRTKEVNQLQIGSSYFS